MAFNFNPHNEYDANAHAFLSASKHSWLSYSDDHLNEVYHNELMKERGTQLHAFAEQANKLGLHMPRNHKTINEFINDGLGYDMSSEVKLVYSRNCFGTSDLITYDERKKLLRIFDLKTGLKEVKEFGQLHIYAALFCLEYHVDPYSISYDLRFYQNDEIHAEDETDPAVIDDIMQRIIHFSELIDSYKEEARISRGLII